MRPTGPVAGTGRRPPAPAVGRPVPGHARRPHPPAGLEEVIQGRVLSATVSDQAAPTDPLRPLLDLPGVSDAVAAARAAVDEVHRHPANRTGWPATAAE